MKTRLNKAHRPLGAGPVGSQQPKRSTGTAHVDRRAACTRQGHLIQGIDDSPKMTLQRKQMQWSVGGPVQRIGDEEELLQGRFRTAQRQADLEDEELLQGKFETVQRDALEDEELLQGKLAQPLQREQSSASVANQTGMPDRLKRGIESLSGMDVSDVRVHYNSSRPAQLNAHAYAQGNEIHIGAGQEKHLPHEAWHTVQQRQGRVQPTTQMSGEQINDDAALEREADVMGEKAARYKQ